MRIENQILTYGLSLAVTVALANGCAGENDASLQKSSARVRTDEQAEPISAADLDNGNSDAEALGVLQSGIGVADPTCARGHRQGDVCCSSSCVTCGGAGCAGRPGGANACCTGTILEAGQSCLDTGPPCIGVQPDPTCRDGIRAGNVCCDSSCGTCGGAGCGALPGGADLCCTGTILAAGVSCLDTSAPCIISVPDPTCSNGIRVGNVCCAASCGTCGGAGCGGRPGGADACCTTSVAEANESCAQNAAPCVIQP